MIPYKDENPTHHIPWITYGIVLTNLLLWVFVQGYGAEPLLSDSICRYGVVPGVLLQHDLSSNLLNTCGVSQQSILHAISSMFMHGSWIHLVGNMWFLWIFADNIEDALRPVKFALFYLLGGLAAVGAQLIADPDNMVPMIGASGAIGGIMGAYAWLYPSVRVRIAIVLGFYIIRKTIPAWIMLGIWFGFEVISGIISIYSSTLGGVAYWAHSGGFLAGFLIIQLFHSKSSA